MDGGRIQFSGTAQELREKPELLHSAYLLRARETRPPRRHAAAGREWASARASAARARAPAQRRHRRDPRLLRAARSASAPATGRRCRSPATGCMPAAGRACTSPIATLYRAHARSSASTSRARPTGVARSTTSRSRRATTPPPATRSSATGVAAVRNDVPGARPRQLFFADPAGCGSRSTSSNGGVGSMQAAVTSGVGSMEVVDVARAPRARPQGEVLVRNEAVGICGSDYHFLLGELSDAAGGSQFPRIQGHEVGGDDRGARRGCRAELEVGQRVALWPLHACGHCYPCSVGRPNTCDNFALIGIHRRRRPAGVSADRPGAGLPDRRRRRRASRRSPSRFRSPSAPSPRGRIEAGEQVVVLGAGPIGQCVSLLARERGGRGADRRPAGAPARGRAASSAPRRCVWTTADEVVAAARDWAGGGGPPAVIRRDRRAGRVRAMVDMVASAGRAVQVGMSTARGAAADRQPHREGDRRARRQLLPAPMTSPRPSRPSSATPTASARLISHEFPLDARRMRCGSRSATRRR